MAQLGRALRSGRRGRRFKSCRTDNEKRMFHGCVTSFFHFYVKWYNPAISLRIKYRSGAEGAGVLWTPFSTDRAGRRDRRCFFHGDWGAPKNHENLHKVRFKIAPYRGSRSLQRIGQTNSLCTSTPFFTYFCSTLILLTCAPLFHCGYGLTVYPPFIFQDCSHPKGNQTAP